MLPDSLAQIGDQAFADCESLESLRIPSSVNAIGQDAFLVACRLLVERNSYAEQWAQEHGQLFTYAEAGSDMDWLKQE